MKYKNIIAYTEDGKEIFEWTDTKPAPIQSTFDNYKSVEVVFDGKEWKLADEEDKK